MLSAETSLLDTCCVKITDSFRITRPFHAPHGFIVLLYAFLPMCVRAENGEQEHNPRAKTKRVRTTFTEEQLQVLQANFNLDSNPDGQDLERIAQITGLSKRVTQVWFQNSRARQKKYFNNQSKNGHSHGHTHSSGQHINNNNNNNNGIGASNGSNGGGGNAAGANGAGGNATSGNNNNNSVVHSNKPGTPLGGKLAHSM